MNECRRVGTVASPYVGGLGGSASLLVRFLGASEKMNKQIKIKVLNQFFKNDKSKLEENSEDSEIHCYSYY